MVDCVDKGLTRPQVMQMAFSFSRYHCSLYVRNIKKYLLAVLFNAPSTIDHYYTTLVNHDLYGT